MQISYESQGQIFLWKKYAKKVKVKVKIKVKIIWKIPIDWGFWRLLDAKNTRSSLLILDKYQKNLFKDIIIPSALRNNFLGQGLR